MNFYDQLLAQFNFEYREQYIDTPFGLTYILESGAEDLPPLFLFHGSSSNSAAWFADIEKLAQDFHIYAVDLIGDAGHSAETRLDMKTDAYAEWVRAIFDSLGIEKASIMGNSLGGWMGLNSRRSTRKRWRSWSCWPLRHRACPAVVYPSIDFIQPARKARRRGHHANGLW